MTVEMSVHQVRMSELGSDAVSVLRIISYFDELSESAANADSIVRSAALLTECPVGAAWVAGTAIRYDALGSPLDGSRPDGPSRSDVSDPEVWLERQGVGHPLDSVLLERLRHSLRVAAVQTVSDRPRFGDRALLEVVLSNKERREDRVRAVGLLGLDPDLEIRVIAVSASSSAPAVELISRTCKGRYVHSATIGNITAVLVQDRADSETLAEDLHTAITAEHPSPILAGSDRGPWVGIGERLSVYAASTSWNQARRALRFASSTTYGHRAIAFGGLGVLGLLAELPLERLLNDRDVARINVIATSVTGAQEVSTVEAFCRFGSLRRTAAELHVHHSTVAARLAHLEAEMGWDLDKSIDRFRATLVLMVRRVALSSAELADAEVYGKGF